MSVEARLADGAFKPLGNVRDAVPGKVYKVFSDDEIRGLAEDLARLRAAETSFAF
jgi:hypothetical protein